MAAGDHDDESETRSGADGGLESEPRLVSVAVPVALDRGFTYRVPEEMPTPVAGARVVVPLGQRVLVGVVRLAEAELPAGELRELLELLDPPDAPSLSSDLIALCEWISDYYMAPIGEVVRLALPGAALGADARRARLTDAGAAAAEALVARDAGPLLARRRAPPGDVVEELDEHQRQLLSFLREAGAQPGSAGLAVASLSRTRRGAPTIPAVFKRLAELGEGGLVEIDSGPDAARQARTEPHYRRTDRLRGRSADEPTIKAAIGRSKRRRALLDYLELRSGSGGAAGLGGSGGSGDEGSEDQRAWIPLSELRGPFPRARSLLPPLLDAGLVVESERLRELDPFAHASPEAGEGSRIDPAQIELTEDQGRALESLVAALEQGRFSATLLHGITGSGKTEVYLRLIERVREAGGGAIVLVPEIALTPQLADRFRARFGEEVAVLHSGLTARQRLDVQGHIRAGRRPIVIGARSAVFAPVPELRAIIVDEEHDGSFKQEEGVRYNARDVALVRARSLDAVVVLGSATPSLESWHGVREGRLGLRSLTTRPTPRPLPEVEVINLKEHLPDPETLLSAHLRTRVLEAAAAGEQSILFLNRRGYTTALSCKTCGSFQQCPDCSAPAMTYHLARNRLMCHLCGHIEGAPERCSSCGGSELEHGAAGTERVEVAIAADLPGVRVLRLDRDTSRGTALLELLARFRRREADVLVGTQMLSKGHDFPGVTLVGVLRADHGLGLPDFRATERVFALLTQVAGRAGRGDRPGRVVIQTWAPDHPAIRYARTHDYEGFAEHELAARASAGNPPLGHLALVRISGEDRRAVLGRARELGERARDLVGRMGEEDRVSALGPVDSPIEKINRRLRMQMLLRAPRRGPLRWVLRHLRPLLGQRGRGSGGTTARVDVDPYSLL